jgi:hypothetical protein
MQQGTRGKGGGSTHAAVCGAVGPVSEDLTPLRLRHTNHKNKKSIMGAYYDEVEIEDMVWDDVRFLSPCYCSTIRLI